MRIQFNPNQPIQSLSGTIGNITYRTVNGRTFAHSRPLPELPKNPTRQQRALFKRRSIIDNCLSILQGQIPDIQEAIVARDKLKHRLLHLYKKYAPTIKAPTKLQKAIMTEYYARFSPTSTRRLPEINPKSTRQ